MSDALNQAQWAAVRHLDSPLLVLAGAGSGKTRVIARKIAYLLEQNVCPPEAIIAVTFTQKAAQEMQSRCKSLLVGRDQRGMLICTFHTLGREILREEHKAAGLRANFTIMDAYDSQRLLQEIIAHDSKLKTVPASEIAVAISQWKNALVDPKQAAEQAEDPTHTVAARAYQRYQRQLKAYHAVDFDDLLRLPVQLWQQHRTSLHAWQTRLGYLLVDEYQDTNLAQYALVKLLVGTRQAFTVVGDDAQAIYGWRGAQANNLLLLEQDFPRLHTLKLEQNYRSTPLILAAANCLISHNPQRFDKQLWSALDHGEAVRVLPCTDEPHEAAQVVEDLLAHRTQRSVALSDYAILYRGNHQARVFEEALRARGVNYTVSGGASFFARPEIKDAVAYMQLLANGSDNNALLRIINTPKRDLGPEILEQLAQFAQQHAMSLLQACAQAETIPALAEGASGRLRQFHAQVQRGAQQAARLGATAGLRALLDDIHYNLWLEAQAMSSKTADKRKHNVGSLLAWLTRLEQQEPALQAPKALVARLALRDLLERRDEQTGTGVALMTLHAAKGLEFPYVYLAGLEEGLLPHQHSLDEGGIEEERRLCYVGITRAQRRLTLSYAQTRRSGTAPKTSTPSRFITELGDGLHWERQPSNLLPAKETRRQRLAELRTLLE